VRQSYGRTATSQLWLTRRITRACTGPATAGFARLRGPVMRNVSAGKAGVMPRGLYSVGLGAALATLVGCSHPTDDELVRNFKRHTSDFHRLVQMVQSNKGLQRVDEDWTSPRNPEVVGVGEERIAEYRKLFRKVDVPRGFAAFDPTGNIQFLASTQGLAVTGSVKGYLYAVQPPTPVVANLDTYAPPILGKSYTAFRHIEGRWYLYYEHDY